MLAIRNFMPNLMGKFVYAFLIYLTTIVVVQNIQCQMILRRERNEKAWM